MSRVEKPQVLVSTRCDDDQEIDDDDDQSASQSVSQSVSESLPHTYATNVFVEHQHESRPGLKSYLELFSLRRPFSSGWFFFRELLRLLALAFVPHHTVGFCRVFLGSDRAQDHKYERTNERTIPT